MLHHGYGHQYCPVSITVSIIAMLYLTLMLYTVLYRAVLCSDVMSIMGLVSRLMLIWYQYRHASDLLPNRVSYCMDHCCT